MIIFCNGWKEGSETGHYVKQVKKWHYCADAANDDGAEKR